MKKMTRAISPIINIKHFLSTHWRIPILTLLFALLPSCRHKGFCDEECNKSRVRVVFDWQYAPQANPESMRFNLYAIDGKMLLQRDWAGQHGGMLALKADTYKAIGFNNDSETIAFLNEESYDNLLARASRGRIKVGQSIVVLKSSDSVRIQQNLDRHLYAAHLDTVVIKRTQGEQVITLYPKQVTSRYRVFFRNVKNLEYAHPDGFGASLSGMSEGFLAGRYVLSSKTVIVPFSPVPDGETTLAADFITFGHPQGSSEPHELCLYVMMSDGKKYVYKYDVTDTVTNASDPLDVTIIIDGPDLQKPAGNTGFGPGLDDWQEEQIAVPML